MARSGRGTWLSSGLAVSLVLLAAGVVAGDIRRRPDGANHAVADNPESIHTHPSGSDGPGEDEVLALRRRIPTAPPARQSSSNDDCSKGEIVTPGTVTVGSTTGATRDELPSCVQFGAEGVWYTLIGDGTTLTVSTCPHDGGSATFDTGITVLCTDCDDLACLGDNDDGPASSCAGGTSRVSFCSQADAAYRVFVNGSSSGGTGNFTMSVSSDGQSCVPDADCDPGSCRGTCVDGSYCTNEACSESGCQPPDALVSMLKCGGTLDNCCGYGSCVGASYCDSQPSPVPPHHCHTVCLDPSEPLSQLACGGTFSDLCGVGTCDGASYCDDCACYAPEHSASLLFCGCNASQCGEVQSGCGLIECESGIACDDCFCYPPGGSISTQCCPGGTVTFQRVYEQADGGDGFDHAVDGIRTADDGFVLAGFGSGAVLRADRMGHLMWSKRLNHDVKAVAETVDGFVMAAYGVLTKLDPLGNVVWSKTLPDAGGYDVKVTQGGDLVVAGIKGTGAGANADAYLLKTDSSGTLLWARSYGASGTEVARSVVEVPDGFLLMGSTTSAGAGARDLLFLRTDSAGNLLWATTLGGPNNEGTAPASQTLADRMILTGDGGVAVATRTGSSALVLKLDADTNVIWANTYGPGAAQAISETQDGLFVLATDFEEFLLSLDTAGGVSWARAYGDYPYLNYMGGGGTTDGGAFIATESHTRPRGQHKFTLLKTDPQGHTKGCCNDKPWPVTAVPVNLAAGAASLNVVTLSGGLPNRSTGAVDYPLVERTVCESNVDYLCGGMLSGSCDCDGTAACARPPTSLVAWWPLDEPSGATAEDIAGGNDGSYRTLTTPPPLPTSGQVARALSFDGIDDWVDCGTSSVLRPTSAVTLDAWVWLRTLSGTVASNASSSNLGYSLLFSPVHQELIGLTGDGTNDSFFNLRVPFSHFQTTRWYHLALTFDGNESRIYVDGALADSFVKATALSYAGNSRCSIGALRDGGPGANPQGARLFFDGLIDEVEIFDRALSASEIQGIYEAGSAGKCKSSEDTDADGIVNWTDNCVLRENSDQADADADGVGDLCDACPNVSDLADSDHDGDGVGDACDNCRTDFNPAQERLVFGQTLRATDRNTLGWPDEQDVVFVKGDLAALANYAVMESDLLVQATTLDVSADQPSRGNGFYYLVRRSSPCGSWQSRLGAEPSRDLVLP